MPHINIVRRVTIIYTWNEKENRVEVQSYPITTMDGINLLYLFSNFYFIFTLFSTSLQ